LLPPPPHAPRKIAMIRNRTGGAIPRFAVNPPAKYRATGLRGSRPDLGCVSTFTTSRTRSCRPT
jgi:hypothetical protein